MLYIVLILVLAALGLLVTALITANSLWAWISLVVSAVAGLVLIIDLARRRSKRSAAGSAEADSAELDDLDDPDDLDDSEDDSESGQVTGELSDEDEPAERTELISAEGDLAGEDEDGDPGEEQTDAADLLVVSELDVEVVVVDEYPRYHVTDCRWLADRDTIPIAVAEARDLGFTPCVRCGPDARLAAEHRAKRKSAAE
ncbi:hypothetical protein [Amycolatopsis nigrescens]|uniref:hypothetical protein n=1 Tax=Amycolatopsis nigrescens TaxID=381445 RepID=UPI000364F9AE|nr:hypothetical protein [Amycolatopsis nigrescens]